MRPTWHFLAPADLRWIQALTGPRVRQVNAAINRRALHLSDDDFATAEGVFRAELSGGRARTRAELRQPLVAAGVPIREPIALAYLAMEAELRAVICSGPRRGRQVTTYALVEDRLQPAAPLDRDTALRELTVRYFASHGPALVRDMSWWSGLTVRDVRDGIALAGAAVECRTIDGKDYWAGRGGFEPAALATPFVRLLSNYDEYLGSYADDSPIFDATLPKARDIGDVLGAHIVVRDGLVVGGWRRSLTDRAARLSATILSPLTTAERAALDDEAARYERFVGVPVELRVAVA